jgi:hypothetical protein
LIEFFNKEIERCWSCDVANPFGNKISKQAKQFCKQDLAKEERDLSLVAPDTDREKEGKREEQQQQ